MQDREGSGPEVSEDRGKEAGRTDGSARLPLGGVDSSPAVEGAPSPDR